MDPRRNRLFRFGPFEIDEARWALSRGGVDVEVQLKPLEILRYLILHRDRFVAREELFQELWPDVRVSDGALTTAIYELRKAIDDSDGAGRRIATLRGLGYRFLGEVQIVARASDVAPGCLGRESELERLEALLDVVAGGERRILLVHGAPGMGRTSLVLDFARRAGERGFSVHTARAHGGAGPPQLWAWIQIVRTMIDAHGSDALRAVYASGHAQLAQRIPALGPHATRGSEPRALREEQRFKLFDVLATYFQTAAREVPLMLVLDDLHCADEASLRLLLLLAQDLRAHRLLIVGTHREPVPRADPARPALLRAIACEPGAERMEVGALPDPALRAALSRALGREPAEPELAWIAGESGGNPYFVTELARALRAQPPGGAGVPRFPETLRDAVRARVDACSAQSQALLRAAAVAGAEGSLALLRDVIGCDAESFVEALDEAERARLMQRDPACAGFRFASALVRETLAADLSGAERMRLHRDVGDALERRSSADPDAASALAHHFGEAALLGRAAAAVEYARRAAARALELGQPHQASEQLRTAVRACELLEAPDPALRRALADELRQAQILSST